MASSAEFVEYVADQLREAGAISCRKMFGEYGLFCDGKFFAVICGDQFFVKITAAGEAAFPEIPKRPPHGSRDYFFLEDVDDRELLTDLVRVTCRALPEPKPKRRKKKHGTI